jgi:hypothetical protein
MRLGTHRMDSFTSSDRAERMRVNRWDLQLKEDSEPLLWWEDGNVHICKVLSLVDVTVSERSTHSTGCQWEFSVLIGHAIAQAVSRWLPTAAARVQARVWQVGFVVDKVALGQVFSEYFGFPCQSSFHQILHHHNHLGQVQQASSGRRAEWTQYGLHTLLCKNFSVLFEDH